MISWQEYKNLDRRKQVLYAAIVVLILLILILGGYWGISLIGKSKQPAVNQAANNVPSGQVNTNQVMNTIDNQSLQKEQQTQQQEKPVRLIAEPFVERFGSYNNQGDFSNFSDLDFYMTAALNTWVKNTYIPQLKQSMPSIDTYFAVNTKVISTTVDSIDEVAGKAQLIINTQRQEVGAGNVQTKLYYQSAKVVLVKSGTEWKVDAVYWQ